MVLDAWQDLRASKSTDPRVCKCVGNASFDLGPELAWSHNTTIRCRRTVEGAGKVSFKSLVLSVARDAVELVFGKTQNVFYNAFSMQPGRKDAR